MKGLKIDSVARTVTEIEVDGLKDMQAVVGGLVECGGADRQWTLYVDEEGLFKNYKTGFMFHGKTFIGNGLLMGAIDRAGNETDCTYRKELVERLIAWGRIKTKA